MFLFEKFQIQNEIVRLDSIWRNFFDPMVKATQDVDVLAVLDFQIPWFRSDSEILRLLLGIPEVCSPTTKAVEENKDVRDDFRDGNDGFKDPGW